MGRRANAQKLPTAERLAKDALREIYLTIGIAPHASDVLDEALRTNRIPDDVIEACTRDGLMDLTREAFKERDPENGLSLARPLGQGKDARWYRITLMNSTEAIRYLNQEAEAIGADVKEFRKYENYFRDKFGDSIPEFAF